MTHPAGSDRMTPTAHDRLDVDPDYVSTPTTRPRPSGSRPAKHSAQEPRERALTALARGPGGAARRVTARGSPQRSLRHHDNPQAVRQTVWLRRRARHPQREWVNTAPARRQTEKTRPTLLADTQAADIQPK
jgi:hypothetical protein